MRILETPITIDELKRAAANSFGTMVKAVVDLGQERLALDAEMHADLEALLLENGSDQKHVWGINLYPGTAGDEFIEFDSVINLRPSQGNLSRAVEDETVRQKIITVVEKWINR
jgi:hypothetical protein